MAYYKPPTAIHWRTTPTGYRLRCQLCPRALGTVPDEVELQVLANAHLRDHHPRHGTVNMPDGYSAYWRSDAELRAALASELE